MIEIILTIIVGILIGIIFAFFYFRVKTESIATRRGEETGQGFLHKEKQSLRRFLKRARQNRKSSAC